jgi:phosphatidylglycerophosphate synthase
MGMDRIGVVSDQLGADSYSRAERLFVEPGRRLLLLVLGPLAGSLARLGLTPNAVSGGQIVFGALFVAAIGERPRLALLFFLVALLLDTLDGAMARRTGRSSRFGAFFDQFCDHARETLVIAGLAANGALSPLLAVLYAFVYAAFNLTLYLCNHHRAALPVALKSYLLVYPALFLFLWSGRNYLDWAVALSLLAMGLVIAYGLRRLRAVMD